MFPLHSGRILGLPGRVLVSVLGAAIALFSATGVWLWWSRRVARERAVREHPRDATGNAGLTSVA